MEIWPYMGRKFLMTAGLRGAVEHVANLGFLKLFQRRNHACRVLAQCVATVSQHAVFYKPVIKLQLFASVMAKY